MEGTCKETAEGKHENLIAHHLLHCENKQQPHTMQSEQPRQLEIYAAEHVRRQLACCRGQVLVLLHNLFEDMINTGPLQQDRGRRRCSAAWVYAIHSCYKRTNIHSSCCFSCPCVDTAAAHT
jgi:hypothetical protein